MAMFRAACWVRAYIRIRFGRIEYVRAHRRPRD